MKHTPTPWIVIYHSCGDVMGVDYATEKVMADGLAEACDNNTAGNVETLSMPANKVLEACNAHEALKAQRDALLKAAKRIADENGFIDAAGEDCSIGEWETKEAIAMCTETSTIPTRQ